MKKDTPQYDENIDLIPLFRIIWNGKIKIILITIISFLLGFGYNSQIPINYLNSLTINASKSDQFTDLNNIKNFLSFLSLDQINQLDQSNQSSELYLVEFIDELKDYEEFKLSIKNTKPIKEYFSKLKIENQEIELFNYSKLLEIVASKKNKNNYVINFTWHDPDEAKKIIQDTLNFTLLNLKTRVFNNLRRNIKFEEKMVLTKDNKRLNFLKEQSSIARELNMADNQINYIYLSQPSDALNQNNEYIGVYLRGYRAINKEIELIQARNYQDLKNIALEINKLKDSDIKLVDYNINLIGVKSLKKTNQILIISILLGFIVGVYYVIVSNTMQSQRFSKNINKVFKQK
jgi:LPS O-antigen subunit length determinant protein (WzzB/FepE family)